MTRLCQSPLDWSSTTRGRSNSRYKSTSTRPGRVLTVEQLRTQEALLTHRGGRGRRASGRTTRGSVQTFSHFWFGLSGTCTGSSCGGFCHVLVLQQPDVQGQHPVRTASMSLTWRIAPEQVEIGLTILRSSVRLSTPSCVKAVTHLCRARAARHFRTAVGVAAARYQMRAPYESIVNNRESHRQRL